MKDLYAIARYQKTIILCILIHIPVAVVATATEAEIRAVFSAIMLTLAALEAVFVFLLALKAFNTATGVAIGLGTLIPCIGLIILVVVNGKATGILQEYGVQVGFLGVPGSEMRRLEKWSVLSEEDDK